MGAACLMSAGPCSGTVEASGFSIVKEFVGHGIGRQLHEEPQVPNHVDPNIRNVRLRVGMVLAIEPMVAAGNPRTRILRDRFTAVTVDGSNAGPFRALCCGDAETARAC